MLFSRVFAFATLAAALPSPSADKAEVNGLDRKSMGSLGDAVVALNERQVTVPALGGGPITQAINNATAILNATIASNVGNLTALTSNITNATDAVVKAIISDVQSIESGIIQARNALFNGIINASGGLFAVITSLTQTEITNISAALTQLISALQKLGPILTVNTSGLVSALKGILNTELTALKALLAPFITPLTTLAAVLSTISAKLNTQPIADAYNALVTFLQQIGAQI